MHGAELVERHIVVMIAIVGQSRETARGYDRKNQH
jgi:hypothetical protein